MKQRLIFAGVALAAAVAAIVFIAGPWSGKRAEAPRDQVVQVAPEKGPESGPEPVSLLDSNHTVTPVRLRSTTLQPPQELRPQVVETTSTNKLEKLNQIRERFRALAAGSAGAALKAAKAVTNENEREAALLTLVTEWTHGELGPARERASNIQRLGLEAGIGMELASHPELAIQWANELTDGEARVNLLQAAALPMMTTDPASGFALSEGMTDAERQKFSFLLFAAWAAEDTQAALDWANGLDDPNERDMAIKAIRTSAPVGIGAVLSMKDGYPVINGLASGSPAELSGQIRAGDRIVAFAQGDSPLLDARNISLADVVNMLRGEPGTAVRIQVMSSEGSADSTPRTVTIIRDQLKFKKGG
jgi:hypothetical protein